MRETGTERERERGRELTMELKTSQWYQHTQCHWSYKTGHGSMHQNPTPQLLQNRQSVLCAERRLFCLLSLSLSRARPSSFFPDLLQSSCFWDATSRGRGYEGLKKTIWGANKRATFDETTLLSWVFYFTIYQTKIKSKIFFPLAPSVRSTSYYNLPCSPSTKTHPNRTPPRHFPTLLQSELKF